MSSKSLRVISQLESESVIHPPTSTTGSNVFLKMQHQEPEDLRREVHSGFGPPELHSLVMAKMIIIRRSCDEKNLSEESKLNHFKYDLSSEDGTCLFMALEQSNSLSRIWFQKSRRPCKIYIVDMRKEVVIRIQRPCSCCFCCWNGFCCNKVLVYSGMDNYLGKVKQNTLSCFKNGFTAYNGNGVKILKISGPCSSCCCTSCNDSHFKVCFIDGTHVGDINKRMGPPLQSKRCDEENFGASFQEDMDVSVKALILATAFLIDLMYYKLGPTFTKHTVDIDDIVSQPYQANKGTGDSLKESCESR